MTEAAPAVVAVVTRTITTGNIEANILFAIFPFSDVTEYRNIKKAYSKAKKCSKAVNEFMIVIKIERRAENIAP